MKVKKRFKLVEDTNEEEFLNTLNQDGYILEAYDGETYTFKESTLKGYYLVEFFYKELKKHEIKKYEKLGYKHLCTFKSQVKGYYYYFINKNPVLDKHRQLEDRYENLLKSKTRVDRFTAVIFASTFVFFTYLFFKTMNQLYIFILLLIVLLGGYFGHTYIETIKRLDAYAKLIVGEDDKIDGNNERRSRQG